MNRRLITIKCGGRNPIYELTEQFKQEFMEYRADHTIKEVCEKYGIGEATAYRIQARCKQHGTD